MKVGWLRTIGFVPVGRKEKCQRTESLFSTTAKGIVEALVSVQEDTLRKSLADYIYKPGVVSSSRSG